MKTDVGIGQRSFHILEFLKLFKLVKQMKGIVTEEVAAEIKLQNKEKPMVKQQILILIYEEQVDGAISWRFPCTMLRWQADPKGPFVGVIPMVLSPNVSINS